MQRIKSMRLHLILIALILVLTTVLIGTSSNAGDPNQTQPCATCTGSGATSPGSGVQAQSIIPGPGMLLYNATLNGGYSAAGTGMRDRGWGTILIKDVPDNSQVIRRYLFWSIIGPAGVTTAPLNYAYGRINGFPIAGLALGSAPNPCWAGGLIFGYMADISYMPYPPVVPVSGNGVYRLDGFASGSIWGDDPWTTSNPFPYTEGASLVIVYKNNTMPLTTIQIYDGVIPINPDSASLTLGGFTAGSAPAAKTTFIVADGQDSPESVQFNGTEMPANFCDGIDRQDGPNFSHGNLQDTNTADVSTLVLPGATSAIAAITADTDCLTWLAQVFSVTR